MSPGRVLRGVREISTILAPESLRKGSFPRLENLRKCCKVIDFSVVSLCARSAATDAKKEPKWSRNRSRKQHKTRSAAPKVRSVAPEARYVAPWSCPVPPEAGVVTVAGTVAAVAVAVAGVVAVAGTVVAVARAETRSLSPGPRYRNISIDDINKIFENPIKHFNLY